MIENKVVRDIRNIDFNELSSQKNFAFIDVSSVMTLVKNFDLLTENIKNEVVYSHIQKKLIQQPDIQVAMKIMERLVAYESIVIDRVGAESINGILPSEVLNFEITSIPTQIYEKAGSISHKILSNKIYMEIEKGVLEHGNTDEYIKYLDLLNEITTGISTIANTNQTIPRAIFYLVLSEFCKAPLFLSPAKDDLLKYVSEMCTSDLLKDIEDTVDKTLLGEVLDLSKTGISLPPLAEHIFKTAYKKKISIVQAMADIRESKDAKKFREWLHGIHVNLIDGTRPGLIEAEKMIGNLRETVQKWAENMDIGLDVTHKYTPFGVGICTDVLEKIGIYIEIPSISFEIKDPILNKHRHFKFIASWYKK